MIKAFVAVVVAVAVVYGSIAAYAVSQDDHELTGNWFRKLEKTEVVSDYVVAGVGECLQYQCDVSYPMATYVTGKKASTITAIERVNTRILPGREVVVGDRLRYERRYYRDASGPESYYCRNDVCVDALTP